MIKRGAAAGSAPSTGFIRTLAFTLGAVAVAALPRFASACEVISVTNGRTVEGTVALSGTPPAGAAIKVTKELGLLRRNDSRSDLRCCRSHASKPSQPPRAEIHSLWPTVALQRALMPDNTKAFSSGDHSLHISLTPPQIHRALIN